MNGAVCETNLQSFFFQSPYLAIFLFFPLIDLFSSPTISTTSDSLICFQEKLANGPFLQEKVKECFKDNPHCLTLVMNPDVSTALVALYQPTLSLIKPARILTHSLRENFNKRFCGNVAILLLWGNVFFSSFIGN